MAMAEREATVVWTGDLAEGSGEIHDKSGALGGMPFTWPARVEQQDERTSPEEMIAAAHAGCYAMALSHTLAGADHPPTKLEVSARVTLDEEEEGAFKITHSDLAVVGEVEGLDREGFDEIAREAERGCPVSNALRGSVQIALVAKLEGEDPVDPKAPGEDEEEDKEEGEDEDKDDSSVHVEPPASSDGDDDSQDDAGEDDQEPRAQADDDGERDGGRDDDDGDSDSEQRS